MQQYLQPLKKRRAIVLLWLLGAWSSKTTKIYHEQLSVHRQQFATPPLPTVAPARVSKPDSITPAHDVTDQLETLLQRKKRVSKQIKTVQGYTIQVYTGSSRQQALKSRNILYTHFPNARPEVQYSSPNYTVRIGKFLDKIEAYSLYAVIKKSMFKAIIRPVAFPNKPHIFTEQQLAGPSQEPQPNPLPLPEVHTPAPNPQ